MDTYFFIFFLSYMFLIKNRTVSAASGSLVGNGA